MKDLLNKAKDKVVDVASGLRPEAGDLKRAADFVVDTASKAATEINQLGKEAIKTDLAKDAAAGAAIGAVVAVPVPVIGPVAGAVFGAGLGVYKSIKHGPKQSRADLPPSEAPAAIAVDVESKVVSAGDKFEELNKLHELKTKGILTEEEFAAEKKKILDR